MKNKRYIPIAAVVLAALPLASAAHAERNASVNAAGSWSRLSTTPASNTSRAGLARTGDGVLHVAWPAKNGTKEDIRHRTVSPTGTPGAEDTIAPGWAGVQNPDLVVQRDGSLRVFFGGTRSTAPSETNRAALHTATAPPSGSGWALQPGPVAQSTDAYAASVGAGLAGDGTPITAFATSGGLGLRFHFGLTPATPDHRLPAGCCQYDPDVAFDAATGQAVLGWFSNEDGAPGLYAQAISPAGAIGQRRRVPGSADADGKRALGPGQRTSISGRLGAPGVYVAYGAGYPTHGSVNLWRFGAAGPVVALARRGAENVGIAAAPSGRLWLMWEEGDAIYATRTNMAATRVGPLTRLAPPARSSSIFSVQGEGSPGPLDLVVNAGSGNDLGFWHRQVLPRLTLATKVSPAGRRQTSSVRFTVLDAGDPVEGARITVGSRIVTTDRAGRATLTFPGKSRPYRARATKKDYAAAGGTFRA